MGFHIYRGIGATLPSWMTEGGSASVHEEFTTPRPKNSGRVPTAAVFATDRRDWEMPRVIMPLMIYGSLNRIIFCQFCINRVLYNSQSAGEMYGESRHPTSVGAERR